MPLARIDLFPASALLVVVAGPLAHVVSARPSPRQESSAAPAADPAPATVHPAPTLEAAAEDTGLARARAVIEEVRAARDRGDRALALEKAIEAIEILLAEGEGKDSEARIALLFGLGKFAHESGDLGAAVRAQRRVVEVRSRTLPPDDPGLLAALNNLSSTLRLGGDLSGARMLQEQVLEVRSRTLPPDHLDLQSSRMSLANTLYDQGDLEAARALFEQALEVRSRILPSDDPEVQRSRNNLALTLSKQGDLSGARALQEQVLETCSRTLPADHPDLQMARHNLAGTLHDQGELRAARALQEQVLEIGLRTLLPDHHDLQGYRLNLANTLSMQGDLSAARALYEQVVEVRSRTLPPDHSHLLSAQLRLASTLYDQGNLSAARALQEQGLEVYTRTLAPDHFDLQAARSNLALTLFSQGDFPAARDLNEQVFDVFSSTLTPDHRYLQVSRLNLARTLDAQGEFSGAREMYEQVVEVFSRTLPPDHPDLLRARLNLAGTLASLFAAVRGGGGENQEEGKAGKEARSRLASAAARSATQTARVATLSSSSREAEERCSGLQWCLSHSLSHATGYGVFDPDPELARDAFLLSETTRASALVAARVTHLADPDERYASLRERIRSAGEELARLVQSGGTREAYDAVIQERDRAQRELVLLASGSSDGAGLLAEPDPGALAKRLSEGEAIVAYRRYTRSEIPEGEVKETSAESLCAFVVRNDRELQLIDLGPIEPIESAARDWRDALGIAEGRGRGVDPTLAADERPAAARLRALVLDPLGASLRGTRRLVIVLDDVLQAVPLDALQVGGTGSTSDSPPDERLADRYAIEVRSTVQELMGGPQAPSGDRLVLLLGGADYFATPSVDSDVSAQDEAAEPAGTEEARPAVVPSLLRGGAWGDGFAPLPGTLDEARGLEELARALGGAREIVRLEKDRASRGSIEALAPQARFLHLATHGWFAPESIRSWNDQDPFAGRGARIERSSPEERIKGSSPMLLCGLALAGANLPADALGRYPGLVTAEEISSWDLSACELAVLSACDTNVGERRAGQGVASLQKALHMAGARTVITSLWKVPDEATKELMLDFYRRIWVEKTPKAQALWEAKMRLRDAKDARGAPRYTTRDWAAWVLTGEPR